MTTQPEELTPVPQLPWYESLRIFLEPYRAASSPAEADKTFSSAEIIKAIEQHHGIPQGVVGKTIYEWILPDDFVRAMRYLGYQEKNTGADQLEWLMKKA